MGGRIVEGTLCGGTLCRGSAYLSIRRTKFNELLYKTFILHRSQTRYSGGVQNTGNSLPQGNLAQNAGGLYLRNGGTNSVLQTSSLAAQNYPTIQQGSGGGGLTRGRSPLGSGDGQVTNQFLGGQQSAQQQGGIFFLSFFFF